MGAALPQTVSNGQLIDMITDDLHWPGVVILDKVYQLQQTNVLYDLHEISGLSLAGVANRETDLFDDPDNRTTSRSIVGYRIRFDSYSDDAIAEILDCRAREGLGPGVVNEDVLSLIAHLLIETHAG